MADVEQASPAPAAGDADQSTQPEATPAVSADTTASAASSQPSEPDTGEASGTRPAQRVDELPEWAQTEIRKARDEAKRHRQSAKETSEQAGKVPDLESQVSELTDKLAARDHELGRIRAVLNTGKVSEPSQVLDVAERINGSTQDELDADADKLVDLFGIGNQQQPAQQRRADPTQGNGHQALNGDPMEAKMRRVLGM